MATDTTEWRARARAWPWPALIIFTGAAVCAGAFIVVGHVLSGDIGLETSKAGIELLAVAILGGAVTWAFRWLDDRRDERRRLDDFRVSVIGELQDAYYQSKTVRRALRAAGLENLVRPVMLNAGQHEIFEMQMEQLDDARTALEKLVDVPQGRERIFGRDHESITRLIHEGETYLGKVTEVWEQGLSDAADSGISTLNDFLGTAKGDNGIKCRLSKPIREAVTRIHALRFSRAN